MAHFAEMVNIIQNNRQRREHRERTKPFDMTPYLFRQRYGFSKEGVRRLVGIVGPVLGAERETNRGQPFTAEEIVCSGLHILRGGHFQRIEGECANTSQSSAFNNLYRFVDAINAVKPEYVHMPDDLEMARNMRWMEAKYGFPNVICGIDGTHCAFDGTPRGIPAGMDPVRFINRKGFNSLNVLVTGGFSGMIYDLVVTAPGSFHDAGIYHQSHVKAWLETKFPRRLCLGDSAFAISPVMITPYTTAEVEADVTGKLRRFNTKHSGARMEMTEHIFAVWKRRWPIIRSLRVHLQNAQRIVLATAVLHNMAILWREELPDDFDEDEDIQPGNPDITIEDDEDSVSRRNAGKIARDNLRERMELRFNM